ncbi:MAG: carbohydrate ABC transporter permease [Beutenbergiaceae bacterium]
MRSRYTWRTGIREGTMVVLALIAMFPVYLLVNMSIRPAGDLTSAFSPTTDPTLENFATAWLGANLPTALLNSALVAGSTVVILVALASAAGYGIVRMSTGWSSLYFYLFMLGLFIPVQLSMIPLYRWFASAGLIGGLAPLILVYVGMRMPFTVFLYVAFMRQLPREYEESASIDGATPLQTFTRIVLPMSSAVTGTAVILNALFAWNDFMLPLLYLGGSRNPTVPVAIYSFIGDSFTNWPVLFATLIIGSIPMLVLFLIVQKSLIRGFASGIKG